MCVHPFHTLGEALCVPPLTLFKGPGVFLYSLHYWRNLVPTFTSSEGSRMCPAHHTGRPCVSPYFTPLLESFHVPLFTLLGPVCNPLSHRCRTLVCVSAFHTGGGTYVCPTLSQRMINLVYVSPLFTVLEAPCVCVLVFHTAGGNLYVPPSFIPLEESCVCLHFSHCSRDIVCVRAFHTAGELSFVLPPLTLLEEP